LNQYFTFNTFRRLMNFSRSLLLGLFFAAGSVFAADPSNQNPFAPASGPVVTAPTESSPLELRGIVSSNNGQTVFGVFDPVKRQSSWVRLDETGQDFVVRSHDPARGTVRIEYQGRVIELQLKEAKIETAAAPPPMPVAMQQPPRPGNMPAPQVATSANSAEEAKRLEGVAQEVRRRRMMRAQAGQQQPQPPPQQPQAQPQPR
jgi:hypothetical protein